MADELKTRSPRVVVDRIHIPAHKVHIHVHRYWIPKHSSHRDGKRIEIKGHWAVHHVRTYDEKGHEIERKEVRFGGNSKELYARIYHAYYEKFRKQGDSEKVADEKARRYAGGTVGKIYRSKEYSAERGKDE